MEANEIMQDEVIEMTEEIATAGSGKGWKIAAGVGLTALVGGLLYKFVAKPIVAKIKAKKEKQMVIDCGENTAAENEASDED
jgi:hypothetical protein